jgi:hypothetical protein
MTAPSVETKASFWEDCLEIFYAPSRVFARRGPSDWGIPLLILVVLTGIISFSTFSMTRPLAEAEAIRGMEASPRMKGLTDEQREQATASVRGFIKFAPIIATVFVAVLPVIVGVLLFLAGKIVGATEEIGSAILVAVFAYFPRILQSLVIALQAVLLPEDKLTGMAAVSLSPARFMNPGTSPALLGFVAGRLDLFVIWSTILLAIGLKVTGKIPAGRAAIAALLVWIVGSILPLVQVLRS